MSASESKWTFAQKFHVDFNSTASELSSRLEALKGGCNVPPATMEILTSDLSRLSKTLSDATGSLPSYDQRQCELQLKRLEKSMEGLRGTSAGGPKFTFKRKAGKVKSSAEQSPRLPPTKSEPTLIESARTLTTFSHRYLTVSDVRFPDSSAGLSVSDLDNCVVNLLPSECDHMTITALHLQRVSGSVILLPQIAGSIILHALSECVIVVGCHQFRMHDSRGVDVYLESRSDPIIEHCTGIRFATYPSSLSRERSPKGGREFGVKDFSHILQTPSPNWVWLPEEGRENSWPISPLQDQSLRADLERMLAAHSRLLENGLQM